MTDAARASDAPPPDARGDSRRAFLAGAAALAVPARASAQGGRRQGAVQRERPPVDLFGFNAAIAAPAEWANPTVRLLRRATMGLTDADVATAKAMGYQNWLQSQLDYTRIDNAAVEAQVALNWPNLSQPPEALFALDFSTVVSTLQAQWLYRAILSPHQLYERMVEFWHDHFNIDVSKVGYLAIPDDRDVIRKYALGKFSDLVKASSKSPAMLAYLDQNLSRVGAPNQNYARELLELHTVGVNGGYTQDDVAELSRVLTGWTLQGRGNFVFNPTLHDFGTKTVMGMTVPATPTSTGAAAIAEGEQVIDMLCNHPSTATFIATKLLKWFITPEPTQQQISTVAGVFRATKGDLKLVVRAVLNSGWVTSAPLKYKRPFHLMVSAMRSLKPAIASTVSILSQLTPLGQPVYLWETPDGFPDLIEYWAGAIMPRWQFASAAVNLRAATAINVDVAAYLAGTSDAAVDLMNTNFFGGEMDLATRTSLLTYLRGGTFNDTRVRETLSLAIASESFQWY
jgi:uncharacterized protein (DUF1800 family)